MFALQLVPRGTTVVAKPSFDQKGCQAYWNKSIWSCQNSYCCFSEGRDLHNFKASIYGVTDRLIEPVISTYVWDSHRSHSLHVQPYVIIMLIALSDSVRLSATVTQAWTKSEQSVVGIHHTTTLRMKKTKLAFYSTTQTHWYPLILYINVAVILKGNCK